MCPEHGEGRSPQRKKKAEKIRLDVLVMERGLAPSRERARAMLLARQILVNGAAITKAGALVPADSKIEIAGTPLRYASRGGLKLEGALEDFGVSPEGRVSLDIGSSNGGFTDCLLQHGAARIYAVDVTIDQIDWKLRQDSRVVLIEKNARYLKPEDIAEAAELIVVDISFISVAKVLPALVPLSAAGADFLILIKPQFELEKSSIGKGGIVRNPALHEKAIRQVEEASTAAGLQNIATKPSRITGAGGNQEFFLHARRRG